MSQVSRQRRTAAAIAVAIALGGAVAAGVAFPTSPAAALTVSIS